MATGQDAPDGGPTWWFHGTLRRFRSDIREVVVEAHWWPHRRRALRSPPVRIFKGTPILLGDGSTAYRVEGAGAGHVWLFARIGDALEPLHPFVQTTGYGVAPGKGIRISSRPAVIGAVTVRGRAASADGMPVAGAVLSISEPGAGRAAEVETGPDGNFTAYGFQAWKLTFTHRHIAGSARYAEFAAFEDRLESVEPPFTLHMPRNPILRVRGRLEGFGEDAACLPARLSIRKLSVQGEDGGWTGGMERNPKTDTFRVLPGRYRIEADFPSAGNRVVETDPLKPDDDIEITLKLAPFGDCAVLEVSVTPGPGVGEEAIVAAEAQEIGSRRMARRISVSTRRALLLTGPGTHSVRGAVKIGEEVWIAPRTTVHLEPGERSRITLNGERAGALRLAASPDRRGGARWVDLKTSDGRLPWTYLDEPFRFSVLSMYRDRSSMHWVLPGVYQLSRRDQDPETFPPLRIEIVPGGSVHVEEGPEGFRLRVP